MSKMESSDFLAMGKKNWNTYVIRKGVNNSHGWNICPDANRGCPLAENGEEFHRVCSIDYEDCDIKLLRDYGGSR